MRYQPKKLDQLAAFVLLLSLLCGLLAAWGWSGRVRSAQQQERADLNLFLDASSAGWAEVTDQFFTVPESAAQSAGALAGHMDSVDERIILLTETIRTSQVLDAAFLGYPNGEFLFVGRSDEEAAGGFRTRQISIDQGERQVVLTWTDAQRNELRREVDNEDMYDPRERPWYLPTSTENAENWTAPYIFSSSQQPGITYSRHLVDSQGQQVGVIGIDMRLSELGGFLDQLSPGSNGEAMVLDVQGEVVAASTMDSPPLSLSDVESVLADETMKRLAASVRQLRLGEASLIRSSSPDGLRTTVTRSVRGPDDWYLTVEATDSDFLGDFSISSSKNLIGIVLIGLAAAIIVGSLGYRLLRYRNVLKAEAEHDELTGLLSRRALRRGLDKRLGGADAFAVAIVDLDNFKMVNDQHGHIVGDAVLAAVGARTAAFAMRHEAIVGRLGGDEFALIGSTEIPWDDLAGLLAEEFTVDSQEFRIGASIGVAFADPQDQQSAEDVLRSADHALFSVKRSGRGRALVLGSTAP